MMPWLAPPLPLAPLPEGSEAAHLAASGRGVREVTNEDHVSYPGQVVQASSLGSRVGIQGFLR